MNKKAIVAIVSLLLLSTVVFIGLRIKNMRQFESYHLLKAIPPSSPLILLANSASDFIKNLEDHKQMVNDLGWLAPIDQLNQLILNYSTTFDDSQLLQIAERPCALLIDNYNNNINYTFLFGFNDLQSQKNFKRFLLTENNLFRYVKKEDEVITIELKKTTSRIFLAFDNGILMVGKNADKVNESLKQIKNPTSVISNNDFNNVFKTKSKDAVLNIFVNLTQLNAIYQTGFKSDVGNVNFQKFGSWASLDLEMSANNISLTGIAGSSNNTPIFTSSVFGETPPIQPNVLKYLPSGKCFFSSYYIGKNKNELTQKLEEYLKSVSKQMPNTELLTLIEGEMALAHVKFSNELPTDKFLLMETKSPSNTLSVVSKKIEPDTSLLKPIAFFEPNSKTRIPIYKAFENRQLSNCLNFVYANTPDKYFTFYQNFVIYSDSIAPLNRFLYHNITDRTILNSPSYNNYLRNFSSTMHGHLFVSANYFIELLSPFFKKNTSSYINRNRKKLENYFGMGAQFNVSADMTLWSINLLHLPNRDQEPVTLWQSKLDTTAFMKPLLINYPGQSQKDILVQDVANKLYLINPAGIILWSKNIEGQIIGDIQPIDFYKNNKIQFAFSTKEKIYIIDRNGNNVGNFPVLLNDRATNQLSVFDYEKNGDLRFMVACSNKLLIFNKQGNLLPDWNFKGAESTITHPAQHIRVNGKDFIIITDTNRIYFLDRKGNERFAFNEMMSFNPISATVITENTANKAVLATISSKGELITIDLPNCQFKKIPLAEMDIKQVTIKPFDNQKGTLLISNSQKLIMVEKDGKIIWEKTFDANILTAPDIYNFGQGKRKIGVTIQNGQIYLLNEDGSHFKGFPRVGLSRFSIGILNSADKEYNLVVTGKNHFLYNYEIKINQ